jgi:DNA-binding NarL/FixJ family response regulator
MDRAKADSANGSVNGIVRLFLLVGNRLLRDTLLRLFRKPADISIVGQGAPTVTTSSEVGSSECDVVLTDSFTPNVPVVDPLFKDTAKTFSAEILLVGMEDDEEEFLAAVRAGSTGYLLKDASASDVLGAVRAVSRGEAVCPPKLCMSLFKWVSEEARDDPKRGVETKPSLTMRQQQLVSLVARGMTNKEIASELNLSEFTVKNHIHRIMKQVDAESRHEVVETVRAHGYPLNS